MEISLTWDLLVIVFFAIIMAYSFIVGKDESVKIVISTYIAIVSVQALGNLLGLFANESSSVAQMVGLGMDQNIVSIIKLIAFVAMIIFLSIRGGFEMEYAKDIPGAWEPVVTGAFGFATSGLLLSSLLTYIAAKPILDQQLSSAPLLSPLLQESTLVQIMVDYQNVWFSIPAILLLVIGFLTQRGD